MFFEHTVLCWVFCQTVVSMLPSFSAPELFPLYGTWFKKKSLMQTYREGTTVFWSRQAVTQDKCCHVLFLPTKCVHVNVSLVEAEIAPLQSTLLLSNCHGLVWGRRGGFASSLAEGRIGCRTRRMHTRCKIDLFWKDFQETLFSNLAQIHNSFLRCWNYHFSKDKFI